MVISVVGCRHWLISAEEETDPKGSDAEREETRELVIKTMRRRSRIELSIFGCRRADSVNPPTG